MEIRNNKQVLRASEMTKLFYVVAMVVLVAILACGGEDGHGGSHRYFRPAGNGGGHDNP